MAHETIRAIMIPEIVKLIAEKYQCSERDALDRFYCSATAELYADDELGLYGQSAAYVFSIYEKEIDYKENKL